MSTTFKVEHDRINDEYYVRGLENRRGPDTRLFYDVPYPETETPEVTNPDSKKAMHSALYDLYQCAEGLHEGDRFETPFGNFKCVSFHVVEDKS